MNYSDWQLARIRNALRAYHRYERSHDGVYFTWKDVQEAIDEYAGVKVLAERLRQFVEGFKDKEGKRKFPAPRDAKLTAIVEFITHEDIALLSKDELKEFSPEHQAPLRLLEYLDQDFDTRRIPPPATLQGMFHVQRDTALETFMLSLTLERADDSGLIQVTQTDKYFDNFDKISSDKTDFSNPSSRVKYGGWAILTPEDNLLIFLKNERNGRNLYYFTIASDQNIWTENQLKRLILLRHDFPLEFDRGIDVFQDGQKTVLNKLGRNVFFFDRVEEAG